MINFWFNPEENKINTKNIIITAIIIVIVLIAIITAVLYNNNRNARDWIDRNIFRKEKIQNNLPSIEINENANENIFAFNKYIGILNENKLQIYDNTGKNQNELTIEVTTPTIYTRGRYLGIAETRGRKLYIIEDKDILWSTEVEGNISQISINKNGYVAVTIVDTLHKTVVALYDNQGTLMFNTILSYNRVVATSISDDSKYLALAEVDTSGTIVQSNIKVISIEDAKNKPSESIKKIYNGENGELITNIKYQDKDKLLCMYTDKIVLIKQDETAEIIKEFENKKLSFVSIELSNASVSVEETASGIFTADSTVNIINSDNKGTSKYVADSVTKEMYTSENTIALNLGAQVEFINTSGWLLKRYMAEQEITRVVLSDSIAGIIYRDKIEIINL